MEELWKNIDGYEGRYQVSNLGRVKSLYSGLPLTPKKHNRGYHHVILIKNGKQKSFLVHRLVANAFIPTSDNTLTINHIDENKLNNRVDNLEWCSLDKNIQLYNEKHPGEVGRPEHKTPVRQLTLDGGLVRIWPSVAEVHRTLNFSTWSVSQCCNGIRKTAHGYKWQYVIPDNSVREDT